MSQPSRIPPPFRATPRQNELAEAWHDPEVTRVLAAGAIRAGKTQAASRLLIETALEYPALYLVARATYRELKDSTQRAMLHGDGALPPLIPHQAMLGGSLTSGYRASDEQVTLANGGQIIFRSLEEQGPEKIRNLSLGGALVDQIEELRYEDGERLFDELIGRMSDRRGPRKLIAIANPAGTNHWLYRRFISDPDPGSRVVQFTMYDNAANLPDGYVDQMDLMKANRPAWWRTFVIGEWGAIEDAALLVPESAIVDLPQPAGAWDGFEACDYGLNGAPWSWWHVDHDGNLIVRTMIYEKETLVSDLAALIKRRRAELGWQTTSVFADPSLWNTHGTLNRWGQPASVATEFLDHDISLARGNNDPRAGLIRLRELLHEDPSHLFPEWHPHHGQPGAPRLFIDSSCQKLIGELREAPLQPLEKRSGGEIVDPTWESRHGHAVAMCRYAVMSRPSPSERPAKTLREQLLEPAPQTDLRAEALKRHLDRANRPKRHPITS